MEEIWKQIDDRYSVSNLGRVKSNYANKERILKPFPNHDGYLKVDIRHGDYRKSESVHKLVAQAFIPNPDNLDQVNHKDEDKTNNCVDNLEWCDIKYNCNYGTRNERKGLNCQKNIFSVDIDGNINEYKSVKDAGEILNLEKTAISKVLSGKANTAGEKLWFYDTEDNRRLVEEKKLRPKLKAKRVYSVDENGNIEYFESASEATRKTGILNIARALKNNRTAGNRNWHYAN